MNLIRTEQISLKDNRFSSLCHYSKNLWNEANYIVRKEFFETGNWTRYNTLAGKLKKSENFKALNAQTGQQILKILDKSWKSFFESIKEYKKYPDKFLGRPKLPKYKPKDGEQILIFTNQQVKINDDNLLFPKSLNLDQIKTRLPDNANLREVRIIPKGQNYTCEIIYKIKNMEGEINKRWYSKLKNNNRIVGIDFGSENIITMANNIGEKPIIIKDDGTGIKSINQFYNKEKAQLQSIYDKQGIKFGTRMKQLNSKRNRKIKDTMHKISKYIVDLCSDNNIGKIIIGHNDNWKQEVNLGKINNQNFVSIPYFILTKMLQYKADAEGIIVKLQQESHTSKCSFLDFEPIEHQNSYKGLRIKRGIFKSQKGIFINADCNGAYNIIRKSEPKAFDADGVGGCGLHPISVNPLGSNIL
ncbi:MAG: transposase [Candidatus Methanoperedens sp.]